MASWLSSVFAYSAVPPIIVLAILIPQLSRKKLCIIISISMIIVSFGYYFTTSPAHLLITEVIQGVSSTGSFTIAIICLVEYTSPRYRGVILTIKTANVFWAVWIANAIGTFTHWRYICVPSFINSIYSLTVFFWPESPTWLASKGRIEECRKVHRWLKGSSEDSERELEAMIASQMEERKRRQEHSRDFLGVVTDRQFYIPVVLSTLMMGVHQLSGKQVCIIYALDMLKKITKSESTAYTGMLILDGVTVLCMYLGCGLTKFLKRRTLLFLFGSIATVFLFATSLYLYLCHLSILIQNDYISITLLVGFSVAIGVGPIILATSLYGEMIPIKYNREAVTVIAVVFFLLQGTLFKVSPYIFKTFEMHGTFLFYGLSVTIGLLLLYKYLPETKDKTVQEIEEYFK
ncbi:facilitated trehalose transporter Tret1-like [Ostrinia nubilalis]|uniref:facilitated trehalose transporter Tret1-like n=1 Tax=Ostrinia nubilalis TaxID=29057 RepID=UPI0030822E7D